MPATSEKPETVPPEFIFIGEHSALDFANTFVMTNGQETDYLRTWADMVDWFSLTGLSVDPGLKLSAARAAEALESVVELRQDWKAELARLISGDKVREEFIEQLNRLLTDTFHEKLDLEGKNGFSLVRFLNFTERNSPLLFSAARWPSFWPSRVTSIGAPIPPHAGSIFTTPRKTIDGSGAAWRLAVIVTKLRSSVSGRRNHERGGQRLKPQVGRGGHGEWRQPLPIKCNISLLIVQVA
jgi:hypothetical protein